ncbi:MAG: phosphatase domain-containing protein [Polyangiales bacterium]
MAQTPPTTPPVIYRWDLDKTYLRTEFDTLRDLLRTAFEPATRKQTVLGASALFRELRATQPAGMHILSGSPEQMRPAIESKLRLDGIRWDRLTLKPSLQRLLRGQWRFLRDQVGYKLGALLDARSVAPANALEVLFGDDAESDAFVYSLYADLLAHRVEVDTLLDVLRRVRTRQDDALRLVQVWQQLPRHNAVRRIFIHLDRVSSPRRFRPLGWRVCPFFNYFQPAVVLADDGLLSAEAALRVGAELVIDGALGVDALNASYADLQRRGFVSHAGRRQLHQALERLTLEPFAAAAPALAALRRALDPAEAATPRAHSQAFHPDHDYAQLLRDDRIWARRAKERALRGRSS